LTRLNFVTTSGVVSKCDYLGPQIIELRVTLSSKLPFRLGQSVLVRLPDSGEARFYSMVNLGNVGENELVFHVKLRPGGSFSSWLSNHVGQTGTPIELGEPLGG